VAYGPVARQGPRNEQRDIGRCLVTAGKHVNNIQAIVRQPAITIIELLGAVFSVWSAWGYITRTSGRLRGIERAQLAGYSPDRKDLNAGS
jgi:hypothetical protein